MILFGQCLSLTARRPWVDSPGLGPFCVNFAFSPCIYVDSLPGTLAAFYNAKTCTRHELGTLKIGCGRVYRCVKINKLATCTWRNTAFSRRQQTPAPPCDPEYRTNCDGGLLQEIFLID